jgi:hypothetical protein
MSSLLCSFPVHFHSFHRVIFTVYLLLKKCLWKWLWSCFLSQQVPFESVLYEWVSHTVVAVATIVTVLYFLRGRGLTLSLPSQHLLQGWILYEVRYLDLKNTSRWILKVAKGYCQLHHVCLPVHLSTWNNSGPAGRSLQKFVEIFNVWLKLKKKAHILQEEYPILSFLILEESCRDNLKTHFMSNTFFSSENCTACEIIIWTVREQFRPKK